MLHHSWGNAIDLLTDQFPKMLINRLRFLGAICGLSRGCILSYYLGHGILGGHGVVIPGALLFGARYLFQPSAKGRLLVSESRAASLCHGCNRRSPKARFSLR